MDQDKKEAILRITEDLHSRAWFFRLILKGDALRWLLPWPLPALLARVSRTEIRDHGVWATFVYLGTLFIECGPSWPAGEQRAIDAGRLLITGAFLIGTLLSVSSGSVASAIIRATISDFPSELRALGTVFALSLFWGLLGGGALAFYQSIPCGLRWIAVLVGALGVAAELNAITFVFRVFLLGLIELAIPPED